MVSTLHHFRYPPPDILYYVLSKRATRLQQYKSSCNSESRKFSLTVEKSYNKTVIDFNFGRYFTIIDFNEVDIRIYVPE